VQKEKFIIIGEIVGVHGIRGVVKVRSYSESPFLFTSGNSVFLHLPGKKRNAYLIKEMQPHKRLLLVSFDGIRDMDAAEALIGVEISVERTSLPVPEDGSYYWDDLIGISVFAENDRYLGRLESILQTGSNDVYVVKNDKKEILIPAIADVVISISLEKNAMRVVLPDGLE
jgi:16S rRNA processing protein RimM